MRLGLIAIVLGSALALGWLAGTGEARQAAHGLSDLPTDVRPARHVDYILAFGSFAPMPIEVLAIDPNGRWVEVEFGADVAAMHDLPSKAWVHVEQITMIAPRGPRRSR